MKHKVLDCHPQEIELKLAVPTTQPEELARRLGRNVLLARRKPQRLQLHSVYYDTADSLLQRQRCVLRIRHFGDLADSPWVQTFKTDADGRSGLSQRGEWETPLPTSALQREALPEKPWALVDPDGTLFERLRPCYETRFTRTLWTIRRRDRSVVEVALDIGRIVAGDKCAPLCELEFELIAGGPQALFEVASQIAKTVSLVPDNRSKAQRAYMLSLATLAAPVLARPARMAPKVNMAVAARRVLDETFDQFCTNLLLLHSTDDPELVHQARVGWRRFKSARRLLRKSLPLACVPALEALNPLLTFLGELRDIDVARSEVLPPLARAFVAGDPGREQAWIAMDHFLSTKADQQRRAVRYALEAPATGAALLALAQWLAGLDAPAMGPNGPAPDALTRRKWARHQVGRIQKRLEQAHAAALADDPEQLHQVRILAKRLRYVIETVHNLLPPEKARRWREQAIEQQKSIGRARDIEQTCSVLQSMDVDSRLLAFLRGVACARTRSQSQ